MSRAKPVNKPKLVPLHRANCFEELQVQYEINFSTKSKKLLCNIVPRILEKAEAFQSDGDEESSYVFYMKYLGLMDYIRKHPNDMYCSQVLSGYDWSKLKAAVLGAEKLSESLTRRYAAKRNKAVKKLFHTPIRDKSPQAVIPLVDITGASDIAFISTTDLFDNLAKGCKVLLFDLRHEIDFMSSHVKYTNIINLPETKIQKGMSASALYRVLPDGSKGLWGKRGLVDIVVLVDWCTTSKECSVDSKLFILKDILMMWDLDVKYKKEPLILDGGFEEWFFKYPTFTTNPQMTRPNKKRIQESDLLESIEYPSLLEQPGKPTFNRFEKPSNSSKENAKNVDDKTNTRSSSPCPSVGTSNHAPNQISRSLSLGTLFMTLPPVDRDTKVVALELYKEKEEKMKKLLKGTNDSLELEKERLKAEEEWDKLRTLKEREAEEEMKMELQEKEAMLLDQIKKLEADQREKVLENEALRIELKSYRNKEEGESIESLDISQENQDDNMKAAIKSKEEERLKISTKREEMVKDRENRNRRKAVAVRRRSREITPTPSLEALNAGGITTTHLRDTASSFSPVKRSHSFLNISNADEDDRETFRPKFDRTIKPLTPPQAAEIRAAQIRDFSPCLGSKGLGLTGLKNLGNTCYMNSVMQCLSHTQPLSKYFSERRHVPIVSSKTGQAVIAEEVAAVIEAMWNSQFRYISMKDLKRVVGQKRPQFNTQEQQDSSEFLTLLMDWLHEDLKHPSTSKMIKQEETESERQWAEFYSKNSSIIVDLFYGQQKSSVTCQACQKASITYETFSNLTLPLPNKHTKCRLEDCMKLYLQGEYISGWICPHCKEPRNAVKKFDIIKVPPILIIHLKRFGMEGWCRKKQTLVNFPLDDYDVSDYIQSQQVPLKYDLFGVSNHYGNLDGGHYTAYCKSYVSNRWYKFDDHNIADISPGDVCSSGAYILFYKLPQEIVS